MKRIDYMEYVMYLATRMSHGKLTEEKYEAYIEKMDEWLTVAKQKEMKEEMQHA